MGKHKKNKNIKMQQTYQYSENTGSAKDEIIMTDYVMSIRNMINSKIYHQEQIITLDDGNLAKHLVNNMVIKNSHDCFLYFASLNLLNSYVKKEYASSDFRKNYFFKPLVAKGIEQILNNNIQNVRFSATKSLCMINVDGLQFSYHCVFGGDKFNNSERNHIHDMWDGLRLQPYAKEIFETAQTLENLSEENKALLPEFTQDAECSDNSDNI